MNESTRGKKNQVSKPKIPIRCLTLKKKLEGTICFFG